MIVHRGSDPLNDKAYNYAIHEILKKKGYDIFHQTDVPPNALESSYQAWETISSPVSNEHLKEFCLLLSNWPRKK